ncbi:MAG: JmjC domain-containing protein [Bdellovibrio bacteriovorus]
MTGRLRLPEGLSPEGFLAEFWQRRPLLLGAALPGFRSPPSPEELAGLACEPGVESRLVLEHGSRPWEVRHGPFDESDFAALPETHWTLLVQDVDKLVPEVAALLDAFPFIPEWRLDDIMISYAVDQGSVGPHTDEYDVFLVQAQGRRRWRIDPSPAPDAPCLPGLDLRILEQFEPREQWVLGPGDVLYLPPGVPHWGIAEGPCMTWSVGMRAPAWRELATAWYDRLIAERLPPSRYRDPRPEPPRHRGEIPGVLVGEIRRTLESALAGVDNASFAAWLGAYLTEPKENLEPMPRDLPLEPEAFRQELRRHGRLERGPSRLLFTQTDAGELLLFAAGETYRLPAVYQGLADLVTESRSLTLGQVRPWLDQPICLELLCTLYNRGHYELPD